MDKIALITGASSGIGKELAYIHAQNGGHLVLVARRENLLQQMKREIEERYRVNVYIYTKDLTEQNAVQELYDSIENDRITIDYLINNAGIGGIGLFHQRAWKEDEAMITLNVVAVSHLTRLLLPQMIARQSGRILNVSSTAAWIPGPMQAVYYASKAYVSSFSNAIAEEVKGTGVTVTTLLPGATDTEFGQISQMDKTMLFDHPASAQKVAIDGYQAMLKGKLNVVSGLPFYLYALMKLAPFLPTKWGLAVVKKMQEVRS